MKYAIRIEETLGRTVIVDADSIEVAIEHVENLANNDTINLDAEDFTSRDVFPSEIFTKGIVPEDRDVSFFEHYNAYDYKASIKEIETGKYIIGEHNGKYQLGNKEERLFFFDECEAENILDELNEETGMCFSLIDELDNNKKTFIDILVGDKIIIFDPAQHDYEERLFVVESIEHSEENSTTTNPYGITCYGKDLSRWDKDACDYISDDYIGVVTENYFVRFVK